MVVRCGVLANWWDKMLKQDIMERREVSKKSVSDTSGGDGARDRVNA